MTASEKKRAKILVALVILGGVVWFWLYRPGSSSSTGAAGPKAAIKANDLKVGQDAQIRIDLLGDNAAEDVGRKNLFQYRQKAPPPQPTTSARGFTPPPTPPQNFTSLPPPAPQFKVFRYEGFSGPTKNGKLLASLSEGGNTYYVREGECIMGQYCVRRLTESQVEIEDIVLNSRRTFPRVQPQ